ncbi:MAG: GFA family protein [Alphaproteobacteria bacterium]|nr:MAG: GFA family protein [Alphaproteobacteria bacterium]
MLEGSCLCGKVAYEVYTEAKPIAHCHCETCRKAHGSAFASVMAVPRDRFRWVRGEDLLGVFESSQGKFRRFCSACGSHIIADRPAEPVVLLRLGCLDTRIKAKPAVHIWRSNGASWYNPKDEIPELPKGIPS